MRQSSCSHHWPRHADSLRRCAATNGVYFCLETKILNEIMRGVTGVVKNKRACRMVSGPLIRLEDSGERKSPRRRVW